jgi:D-Tyr-tRNAtyr deacylase
MWKASVQDIGGDILCVSQFTLMANTSKGNKPDFHRAMVCPIPHPSFTLVLILLQGSDASRDMYSRFLQMLGQSYNVEKIKGKSAR